MPAIPPTPIPACILASATGGGDIGAMLMLSSERGDGDAAAPAPALLGDADASEGVEDAAPDLPSSTGEGREAGRVGRGEAELIGDPVIVGATGEVAGAALFENGEPTPANGGKPPPPSPKLARADALLFARAAAASLTAAAASDGERNLPVPFPPPSLLVDGVGSAIKLPGRSCCSMGEATSPPLAPAWLIGLRRPDSTEVLLPRTR